MPILQRWPCSPFPSVSDPLGMLKEQCLHILGRRTRQDSVPNAELPSVTIMNLAQKSDRGGIRLIPSDSDQNMQIKDELLAVAAAS